MNELMRQAVHLSTLVLVLLSPFAGQMVASALFFAAAFALLAYPFLMNRGRLRALDSVSSFLLGRLERKESSPYVGAFWLFFAYGLTLLLFPLAIALVSCSILAVSDSVSTLVGVRFGRHKTIGGKSLEGSMAFFISAFAVSAFFLSTRLSLLAAGAATIAELLPDAKYFWSLRKRELIDDNLLIPLVASLFLYFVAPYL